MEHFRAQQLLVSSYSNYIVWWTKKSWEIANQMYLSKLREITLRRRSTRGLQPSKLRVLLYESQNPSTRTAEIRASLITDSCCLISGRANDCAENDSRFSWLWLICGSSRADSCYIEWGWILESWFVKLSGTSGAEFDPFFFPEALPMDLDLEITENRSAHRDFSLRVDSIKTWVISFKMLTPPNNNILDLIKSLLHHGTFQDNPLTVHASSNSLRRLYYPQLHSLCWRNRALVRPQHRRSMRSSWLWRWSSSAEDRCTWMPPLLRHSSTHNLISLLLDALDRCIRDNSVGFCYIYYCFGVCNLDDQFGSGILGHIDRLSFCIFNR